jgi:Ala-tRNA(Pro) deacylase
MAIPTSIAEFLKTKPYTALAHRTVFTAQEEAAATHVPGREWAKTVVCMADEQPILAVLPAHHRIDLDRLRRLAGAATIRLATEPEMARLYPACETGAVPPLGPLFDQPVFVDRAITEDTEVVFHAGTHTDAVRLTLPDFQALARPTVGEFGVAPGRRHGAAH